MWIWCNSYYNTHVLKSIFIIYGLGIVIKVIIDSLNIIKISTCDNENPWLCNDIMKNFERNCLCVCTPSPSWRGAKIRFGQVFCIIAGAIDGMRVSPLFVGTIICWKWSVSFSPRYFLSQLEEFASFAPLHVHFPTKRWTNLATKKNVEGLFSFRLDI